MSKREKIIVIGGGYSGIITALLLSQEKSKNGELRYDVNLIESQDELLKGASEAAKVFHNGTEYGLDRVTSENCQWGTTQWITLFGALAKITTDLERTWLLISKQTQKDGEEGKAGSITLEKYRDHAKNMDDHYRGIIDYIYNSSLELQVMGNGNEEEAKKRLSLSLFGSSLYEELKPEEWLPFYGDNIAGGFRTGELGINSERLQAMLKIALDKASNIKVITNAHAEEIERIKGKKFKLHLKSGEPIIGDQIVQATGDGGFKLDGQYRKEGQHKKVKVYRRGIALIDISVIEEELLPPNGFLLKDENGGMFWKIDEKTAFVYDPKLADLSPAVTLDSSKPGQWEILDVWRKKLSPKEEDDHLKLYMEALTKKMTFLKDAKPIRLIQQRAINLQDSRDERRHEPTEEIIEGLFRQWATKAVLCVQSAAETVSMVNERSNINQDKKLKKGKPLIDGNQERLVSAPNLKTVLIDIIHGKISLGDLIKIPEVELAKFIAEQNKPKTTLLSDKIIRAKGDTSIIIYTENTPRTGNLFSPIDSINQQYCYAVDHWIKNNTVGPLTNSLVGIGEDYGKLFANALQNLLMCSDKLDKVAKYFPDHWQEDTAWGILFGKENMRRFPKNVWSNIIKSLNDNEIPSLAKLQRMDGSDYYFKSHSKLAASVIPIAFSLLSESEKSEVAIKFAEYLSDLSDKNLPEVKNIDREFFKLLANPDINRVKIHGSSKPMMAKSIVNSGRSIRINFASADELNNMNPEYLEFIEFQGRKYYPVQLQFDRTTNIKGDFENGDYTLESDIMNSKNKPDGDLKYKIYPTKDLEKQVKRKEALDPNEFSVGEIIATYVSIDAETGERKVLSLCSHVRLGETNPELKKYTDKLSLLGEPLKKGEKLVLENVEFNPLRIFPVNFDKDGVFQTGFKSVNPNHANTPLGKGVDVLILGHEHSVQIDLKQLKIFQDQIPKFSVYDNVVYPIAQVSQRQ